MNECRYNSENLSVYSNQKQKQTKEAKYWKKKTNEKKANIRTKIKTMKNIIELYGYTMAMMP